MRSVSSLILAIVLAAALAACGGLTTIEKASIAETANDLGNFTTLITALEAAELDGLFADDAAGPFTVFAPTDDAFAALPEGVLDIVLDDPTLLEAILTYHVVAGALSPTDIVNGSPVTTLSGIPLYATPKGGLFILNGEIEAVAGPVQASNGIIYAIDSVLLPLTIAQIAQLDPRLTTLGAAIGTIDGMALKTLEINGSYDLFAANALEWYDMPYALTVFAPTNAAFDALGVDGLLDAPELADVLLSHVVDPGWNVFAVGNVSQLAPAISSVWTSDDIARFIDAEGFAAFRMLSRTFARVTALQPSLMLNYAVTVLEADIVAIDGIVHVVDTVLGQCWLSDEGCFVDLR